MLPPYSKFKDSIATKSEQVDAYRDIARRASSSIKSSDREIDVAAAKLVSSSKTIYELTAHRRLKTGFESYKSDFERVVSQAIIETQDPAELETITDQMISRLLNPAVMSEAKKQAAGGLGGYVMPSGSRFSIIQTQIKQLAGFVSRPDAADYQHLFTSGDLKASVFQFQNREIVSALLASDKSFQLVMQGNDNKGDTIGEQILGPNELTIAAVALNNARRASLGSSEQIVQQAFGISSPWTFHPKLGVINQGADVGKLGFIGTQNITAATSKYNTLESVLVMREYASAFETIAVREIESYTDAILEMAQSNASGRKMVMPGEFVDTLAKRGVNSRFLYTDTFILERLKSAISIAATHDTDRVFISMNELDLLLGDTNYIKGIKELKEDLSYLAETGRLSVTGSAEEVNRYINALREGGGELNARVVENADANFIRTLLRARALHTAPTQYFHDKTVAVFSDSNELKFLSIGSANLTPDSVVGLKDLPKGKSKENITKKLLAAGAEESEIFKALISDRTAGTEIVLAAGVAEYKDLNRNISDLEEQATQEYFTSLTRHSLESLAPADTPAHLSPKDLQVYTSQSILAHYEAMTGGELTGKSKFERGYTTTTRYRNSLFDTGENTLKLLNLKDRLDAELGKGNVHIVYDLKSNELIKPSSLKVTIPKHDGGEHSLSFDLTVNAAGDVVVLDLNKVLNAGLFVNKSQQDKTLKLYDEITRRTETKVLKPGESVVLNSIDVAAGFVNTFKRAALNQQEFALTADHYQTFSVNRPAAAQLALKQWLFDNLSYAEQELSNLQSSTTLEKFGELSLAQREVIVNKFTDTLRVSSSKLELSEELKLQRDDFLQKLSNIALLENYSPESYLRTLNDFLLEDQAGIASDIKREIISRDTEAEGYFTNAARAQSRGLLTYLTAPFLAAHEQTYGNWQAQARMPVYGEEAMFGTDEYGRVMSLGILNPLPMTHGTRLGEPGSNFRAIGAVAYAENLKLPGHGGLRQLTVLDSDLSSEAAVVYNMEILSRSLNATGRLTKESFKEGFFETTGLELDEEQLAQEMRAETLYYFSFPQEEQIPQRLKNALGQRPGLNVSKTYVARFFSQLGVKKDYLKQIGVEAEADTYIQSDAKSGGVRAWYNAEDFLDMSIKPGLNELQFEMLSNIVNSFEREYGVKPSTEQLLKHLETLELDPLNTKKGILAPRGLKRVAVHTGFSTLGDYALANAGYKELMGTSHIIRFKVNPGDVNDITLLQNQIAAAITKQTFITSEDLVLEEKVVVSRAGKVIADNTQNKKPITLGRGLYKDLGVDPSSLFRVITQVGRYTDAGFIELIDSYKQVATQEGLRFEPISAKFPAFSKRYQHGAGVVSTDVHHTVSARGVHIFEFGVEAWSTPTSGMRQTGAIKAPLLYTEEEIFNKIDASISSKAKVLTPQDARAPIYQLTHFGTFKSFNPELGINLIQDKQTRAQLLKTSGQQVARALSLLLLGDKEVKQSLVKHFERAEQYETAYGLSLSKGYDTTAAKDGSFYKAYQGLLAFGTGSSTKEISESIKAKVITALGEGEAAEKEQRNLLKVFKDLIERSVSKELKPFSDSDIGYLPQGNAVVRGAGMAATMLYYSQQALSDTPMQTVEGAYEVSFDDYELYTGVVKKRGRLTTDAYRHLIQSTARTLDIPLDKDDSENKLQEQMALMQAFQSKARILETLVEISPSQSLVPTGLKDSVKMEFQYLLGMNKKHLDSYRELGLGAEKAREAFSTYLMAIGLRRDDLLGVVAGTGGSRAIEYRLAFAGQEEGLLDSKFFNIRKALLAYSETFSNKKSFISDLERAQRGEDLSSSTTTPIAKDGELRLTSSVDDYLAGLTKAVNEFLPTKEGNLENAARTSLYSELYQSRQLILPNFDTELDEESGLFKVRFRPFDMASPTVGVLLGADILGSAATSFGSYKDEILTTQVKIIESLQQAQPLLTKIWEQRNSAEELTMNEAEVLLLRQIEQVADQSRHSLDKIADSEMARRAFGDHEVHSGANAISVNSFALAPDELVLGSRFYVHSDARQLTNSLNSLTKALINTETPQLKMSLAESTVRSLAEYSPEVLEPDRQKQIAENLIKLLDLKEDAPWEVQEQITRARTLGTRGDDPEIMREALDRARTFYDQVTGSGNKFKLNDQYLGNLLTASLLTEVLQEGTIDDFLLIQAQDSSKNENNLEKFLANRTTRSAARAGMPGLAASMTTQQDNYYGVSVEEFSKAIKEQAGEKAGFIPDQERFSTGSILPSISRVVAGLGDYDGDSFRIVLGSFQKRAQLANLTKQLDNLPTEAEEARYQVDVESIRSLRDLLDNQLKHPLTSSRRILFEAAYEEYRKLTPAVARINEITNLINAHVAKDLITQDRAAEVLGTISNLMVERNREELKVKSSSEKYLATRDYNEQIFNLIEESGGFNTDVLTARQVLLGKLEELTKHEEKLISSKERDHKLPDLAEGIKTFFQLPEYMTQDLSTGELLGLLKQKYDAKRIEESASKVQRALSIQNQLMQEVTDPASVFARDRWQEIRATGLEDQDVSARLSVMPEQERLLYKGLVEKIRSLKPDAQPNIEEFIRDFAVSAVTAGQPAEEVSGLMKKATGSLLSPFEFDAVTQTLGYGGSSVLGQAYNTLMPLMEAPMLGTALLGLNMFDTSNQEFDYLPETMRAALKSEGRESLRRQYTGTVGLLVDFQQLVRDSLKPKSDGSKKNSSILDVFNEGVEFDEELGRMISLGEYLNREQSGKNQIVQDKERLQMISKVLTTKIGSSLGKESFLSGGDIDYGITGFGALTMLARYVSTKEEDLKEEFFNPVTRDKYSLMPEYEQSGGQVSMDRFVAEHILTMMRRSQAAYLSSRMENNYLEEFASKALAQYEKYKVAPELTEYEQAQFKAIQTYDSNRQAYKSSQLVNELIYQHLAHTQEQYNILTADTLETLRKTGLAKQTVLYSAEHELGQRLEQGNTLTINQMIMAFRTNKHLDAETARGLATLKLENLSGILSDYGDISYTDPNNQETMTVREGVQRSLLHSMINNLNLAGVSKEDRLQFVENLMKNDGLARLTEHSAMLSQTMGLMSDYEQMQQMNAANEQVTARSYEIEERLMGLLNRKQGGINPETARVLFQMQSTYQKPREEQAAREQIDGAPDSSADSGDDLKTSLDQLIKRADEQRAQARQEQATKFSSKFAPTPEGSYLQRRPLFDSAGWGDLVGIFASPIAFALASGQELKLDERMAMFGLDVYQGLAQQMTTAGTTIEELSQGIAVSSSASRAAQQFQAARLKASIAAQGSLIGSVQGLSQELIMRGAMEGFSRLTSGYATKGLGGFLASLGSEVLGSAFSAGIARALTGGATVLKGESRQESFLSKILGSITDLLWNNYEEQDLFEASYYEDPYQILDEEDNESIDFETTAITSDYSRDIEQGLVVLDADGNQITTEFSDQDQGGMKSVSARAGEQLVAR